MTLRELMISDIQHYGKYSVAYNREDSNVKEFSNYFYWLNSLPSLEFLNEYNIMNERINQLLDNKIQP